MRHGRAWPGHSRLWLVSKEDVDARHKAGHDEFGQSAVTPLALIGAAHFSISLFTNAPSHSGLCWSARATVAPRPFMRSCNAGVLMASTAASLSFLTTAGGAPLGRNSALQV